MKRKTNALRDLCIRSLRIIPLVLLSIVPYAVSASETADLTQKERLELIAKTCSQKIPKKENRLTKEMSAQLARIESRTKQNKRTPYNELEKILHEIHIKRALSTADFGAFIKKHVQLPQSSKEVNLDYVRIKWMQISAYRDDNRIDLANKHQKTLSKYLSTISVKNNDFYRATIYECVQELVLLSIQRDAKKGLATCEPYIQLAQKLQDTSLYIMMNYYKCEFYVNQGKLQPFIDLSEECLQLDLVQKTKSDFFNRTLMHLVDAYAYEGKHPTRALKLLDMLSESLEIKSETYCYYAKFLSNVDPDDSVAKRILANLGVDNVLDFFVEKYAICKQELYPLDFYQFIRESAKALAHFGYSQEAMEVMEEAIFLIKTIYTEDLSETIAYHEKNILEQKKNLELKYAEQISNLYLYILICTTLLLPALFVILSRKMQQNKKLKAANKVISNKSEENAILMSELHHRVKNNFQIISSMFSIQVKNIDDDRMKNILLESQSRISSMALTHEKLYSSDNLKYNLAEYLKKLHNHQIEIFKTYPSSLELDIPVKIDIDADMTIALGPIFNELLTNSLKYASTEGGQIIMRIAVQVSPNSLRIQYTDSGKGIDESINFKEIKTMGLRLVNRLTRQLQGSVNYKDKTFYFELPTVE